MKEVLEFLATPFDPGEVDFKVQTTNQARSRGMVVSYVDARTVQNRLDEAVKAGLLQDWEADFRLLEKTEGEGSTTYVVECVLSLKLPGGHTSTRKDVGEGDSLKAAYSDALKRAAVHFGVARYFYSLEKEWVDLKEGGQIPPEEIKRLRGKLPRPGKATARADRPVEASPGAAPAPKPTAADDLKDRLRKADEALEGLIAQLKEKGLGKEAAQVVLQSGYKMGEGKTEADLEKARTLYKALKALLE